MAEPILSKTLKEILLLSDRYEMKARLLPGVFAVAPLAVAAYVAAASSVSVLAGVGVGALVETLLMLFAGHVARVLGAGYETRLFNGRLPTEVWLSDDSPRSRQQREQWVKAVNRLTKLDISRGDEEERAKLVRDAVSQLRGMLRGDAAMQMAQVHNEEYGFARNLAGLAPVWLASAVTGASVCLFFALRHPNGWVAFAIELVFAVAAATYLSLAGVAVRWAADRYAEDLLTATVVVANRTRPRPE